MGNEFIIASEAKQSRSTVVAQLDCCLAALLAMTKN
jgi:hypothetical protein